MTSARRSRRKLGVGIACVALASFCVLAACSSTKETTPGQLVVAIDTDMALPDEVDTIELVVTVEGNTLFDNPMPVGVGADAQPIPATLTLVAGPDPSVPATIRVIGWKNGVPRTLRQVTSTVPTDRVATLRMPVQWLCDGTAQAASGADGGMGAESTCPDGTACQAGTCVPEALDSAGLPTYEPGSVFGGGSAPSSKGTTSGTCFDTINCMIGGSVATPGDPTTCTVPIPADTSNVNIALQVANGGICDTTGETCFVPLDGDSVEGWTVADGVAALPPAVCDKLRTGLVQAVVVSTSCPTKTASTPPCGAWSSVTQAPDSSVAAAVSALDGSAPPSPTLLSSLVPNGGASSVCCPLLDDGSKLYTCLCDNVGPPRIVSVDPSSGATTAVGTFSPHSARSSPYAAAVASTRAGSQFYWLDRTSDDAGGSICPVNQTPLAAGGTSSVLTTVSGDVYDGIDNLLADPNDLYTLADHVTGAAPTIQLLRIDRTAGTVTALDTGGASGILQPAEDPNAVYVVVDTDESYGDGGPWSINSQVVAFPKSATTRSLLQQVTVQTSDQAYGGIIGLRDDGTSLFALCESGKGADGTVEARVYTIDTSDAGPTGQSVWPPGSYLYDDTFDPSITSMSFLGAVDGALLLERDVTPPADAGVGASVTESSILVIPSGGGTPRIVASFQGDRPLAIRAPTFSPDTFWLNLSGRVFRLPAAALR